MSRLIVSIGVVLLLCTGDAVLLKKHANLTGNATVAEEPAATAHQHQPQPQSQHLRQHQHQADFASLRADGKQTDDEASKKTIAELKAELKAKEAGTTKEETTNKKKEKTNTKNENAELTPNEVEDQYVPLAVYKEAVQERRTEGHHLFAASILCFMMTMTVAFALVSTSNKVVVANTWGTLDTTIVVIIAHSIFYVTSELFEWHTKDISHWKVPLHIEYAIVLYLVATFGSYAIRLEEESKTIFDAVSYWVVLLAKGGALTAVHQKHGDSLHDNLVIMLGSLVFFALLIYLTHLIKPQKGWYDATETALAGGAFAGGFVTVVDQVLKGHASGGSENALVSDDDSRLHGAFAFATCVAAVCLVPPINNLKKKYARYYWFCRFLDFLNAFIGILPYFTVSLGITKYACSILAVGPNTHMASLVSVMVASVTGVAMILACAFFPCLKGKSDDEKECAGLILGFGGYIIGAKWSGMICNSVQDLPDGRDLDTHRKVEMTMGILFIINVILVPVYVIYIKRVIMAKTA